MGLLTPRRDELRAKVRMQTMRAAMVLNVISPRKLPQSFNTGAIMLSLGSCAMKSKPSPLMNVFTSKLDEMHLSLTEELLRRAFTLSFPVTCFAALPTNTRLRIPNAFVKRMHCANMPDIIDAAERTVYR